MDTMVRLAIERMNEEIERLKSTVKEQQLQIAQLQKQVRTQQPITEPVEQQQSDELLDMQQVKRILNIGKNSLLKLVREGVLVAIKINRRAVRYSRRAVMEYIEQKRIPQTGS
jgi:excisionase family DNA binding protein